MIPCIIALATTTQTQPLRGDALLNDLQHRAVQFFWNESHTKTGFTKDRAANNAPTDKYDVASCAAIGFALTAYPIGVERKWLARPDALERTRVTLRNLVTKYPNERGWLYHFVNWETGERVWKSEASSIDTSICLAGVLAAERYWKDPQITRDAKAFVDRIDWKWMMTDGGKKPTESIFSMGWHPESGFIESRWSGYSEEKMLYIQGYGADPTLNTAGWDLGKREHHNYKGIEIVTGGPLFIHQMSESFYPFANMRDRRGYNYWVATRNAALANRQYGIDNPQKFKGYGPDFWGLSASDSPDGYRAFGAPGWIEDNGTITPTSVVAAVTHTPKESLSFVEAIRREHPNAWGRYGFPNGYNPSRDWIDPDVIGIDLGMMLTGVENYRTGLVHRLSMSHPIAKRGYQRAGLRTVPGSNRGPLREGK
jgi:hypothetical protein